MSSQETIPFSTQTVALNGQVPLSPQPAAQTLAALYDALKHGNLPLLGYEAHDEGNAHALYSVVFAHFRYTEALGWFVRTESHWEREGAALEVQRAATEVLHARYKRAVQRKNAAVKQCAKPQARTIKNAIELFRPLVQARVEDFDASPDHLNVANGVLNLRTGVLEPHTPGQRFTYCLPIPYDPEADATEWLTFLAQVVDGGEEVLAMLQQAVGYSLTGHTREEKLFYLHGPTRAGKGTFTEVLLRLLGKPLSAEVDFRTFTARRDNDSSNFDLAPLRPARLLVASESSRYDQLNTSRVKLLTGGNDVRCCFKHRDHFEYRPQYKIWLVSNHDIQADPDDDAAWGRIIRIEFPHSFFGKEDKGLKERLKQPENLRGVLAWAVAGAQQWYASHNGLQVPPVLQTALDTVRAELDTVQEWLDLHTAPTVGGFEAHKTLYGLYKDWCKEHGETPCGGTEFGRVLTRKGYAAERRYLPNGQRERCRIGLRLVSSTNSV